VGNETWHFSHRFLSFLSSNLAGGGEGGHPFGKAIDKAGSVSEAHKTAY
jgi:hypothetical protein